MRKSTISVAAATIAVLTAGTVPIVAQTPKHETRIAVTFTGGYDTDPRDHGRPVVLVAAALGVPTDTFRKAFSGVTPARDRAPDPRQVHRNKDALLAVLAPFGITNDRLDEVSDFYRYRPGNGEVWRNSPAKAYAVVANNKIQKIVLTGGGYGYSSKPQLTVPGFEHTPLSVSMLYAIDLTKNGSIASISLAH